MTGRPARFGIRYRPDTELGRRFSGAAPGHFATREEAENIRLQCANADSMETVEVDDA